MNLTDKIMAWCIWPWVTDSPPMMDPKLISGVHVAIDFTIATDAEGLADVLSMVRSVRRNIEALHNLKSSHIGHMVELCGPLKLDTELHALTPGGANLKMAEANKPKLADAYNCPDCGMRKTAPYGVTPDAFGGKAIECPKCGTDMEPEEVDNG